MRRPKHGKEIVFNGKKFITIRAAADRLGLTYSTLYQWSDKERTPSGKPLEMLKDNLTGQRFVSEECVELLAVDRFQTGLHSLGTAVASPEAKISEDQPAEEPQDSVVEEI